MRWNVKIPYQEPTYSARQGETKTYTCSYEVTAPSRDEAIREALRRFEGLAKESGVRWIREPLEDQVDARALA